MFNATVSAENDGTKAATLQMRMIVDGVPEDGTYSTTIAPGAAGNLAGLLKCNGMPVGVHTVELQLLAGSDLVIDTAADEGLRPIVILPGIPATGS